MSVDISNYDLTAIKGDQFYLNYVHTGPTGDTINLNALGDGSDYTATMHIRRSKSSTGILAALTEDFPAGCFGRTGATYEDWTNINYAVVGSHTGGIVVNDGNTAGAIHLELDAKTTYNLPVGRNYYDLQLLNNGTGVKETILRGDFNVIDRGTENNHTITHYGGDTFILDFFYKNPVGDVKHVGGLGAIGNDHIGGYSAEMRIMKSPNIGISGASGPEVYCRAFNGYPYGVQGATFRFHAGDTVPAIVADGATTGGIRTDGDRDGLPQTIGQVHIEISHEYMSKIPAGRLYYDVRIDNRYGEVKTIREGIFDLSQDITSS